MGPPAFYTKVLNYMKVGQHYYSTLYKGQEPLELLMVFNPDPSQLSLKYLKETSLFRILYPELIGHMKVGQHYYSTLLY